MKTANTLQMIAVLAGATVLAVVVPATGQNRPRQPIAPAGAPTPVKPLKQLITPKQLDMLRSLRVEQVTGTVDLSRARPELVLDHKVRNTSSKALTVQLGARGAAVRRLRIPARSERAVQLKVPVEVQALGRQTRAFQVSPQLLVDQKQVMQPTRSFAITIRLPREAKKIVKSNKPLRAQPSRGGSLVYRWDGANQFLTTLAVWWTSSDIDLELEKSIKVDRRTRIAEVTVKVKNAGRRAAQGVTLTENFAAQEVTGESRGSAGRFRVVRGQVNDQRLLWSYQLARLAPGRSRIVKYRLRATKNTPNDMRLYETVAEVGGEPIAMSNMATAPL